MSGRALLGRVRVVLAQAIPLYDGETGRQLHEHLERLDGPLRVAIAGKVKAGKSTLLNALVGERIAATDAGECTRVVTWYRHGKQPKITLWPKLAEPRELPVRRLRGALQLSMSGLRPEAVDRLTIDWPSASLRDTTLIDTPGVGSASADVSAHAVRFLTPGQGPGAADAVVYLMRHLHGTDLRLLESFHDNTIGRGNPLSTVAVLSRADEVGVGRLDALQSARRVAERYRTDEQLRLLCGTVVPVAGLLAQTARTMLREEFDALAALTNLPRVDLDAALLSVDRFTSPHLDLSVAGRVSLLDRFGLFGIRLATVLLRQGFDKPHLLAAELARRSGIDALRGTLASRFTERRDLLKARAALLTLDEVLRTQPPRSGTEAVRRAVEHILAGAHEFAEMRVLGLLHTGHAELPEPARVEAERLLGGAGGHRCMRLALPPGAGPAEQRAVAMAALRRWQSWAEHPMSSRSFVAIARVVIRTCEGMVADLA